MNKIIDSILDNDLYKFSMQHAVLQKFPNVKVKYTFTDRSNEKYPVGFDYALIMQINAMENLRLTDGEKYFLSKIKYFPQSYIDFLRGYQYNPTEVKVYLDKFQHLHIEIEGYWYRTILWEVPILAIVSELYYNMTKQTPNIEFEKISKSFVKWRRIMLILQNLAPVVVFHMMFKTLLSVHLQTMLIIALLALLMFILHVSIIQNP